jgi:hypothetical protein
VRGFKTRFHLYTVPGQVFYDASRKLILRGVDGVVFVADSQASKIEENIESLANLRENLTEYGKNIDDLPLIIQYNKRDLPNVLSIAELQAKLNPQGRPYFEAVATTGEGVFPTLKALAGIVLESLNRERRRPGPAARPRAPEVASSGSSLSGIAPPDLSGPSPASSMAPIATAIASPPRAVADAPRATISAAPARPKARVVKRPKVLVEDDRSSMVMVGLLVVIILAAAGVILYSFNVI